MPIKVLQANKFNSRASLEQQITSLYGANTDAKPNVEFQGTRKELAILRLSRKTTVWGIRCIETDRVPDDGPPKLKVNRGRQYNFGIGVNLTKNPNNG